MWNNRINWTVLILFMIYTFAGFFVMPWIAELMLPKILKERQLLSLSVEDIDFNPWVFRVEVEGLVIETLEGEQVAQIDEVMVNINPFEMLGGALSIERARFTGPHLRVIRHRDGHFNYDSLIKATDDNKAESDGSGRSGGILHLQLNELRVIDGRIDFTDETKTETFELTLYPLQAVLSDMNTKAVEEHANAIWFQTRMRDETHIDIDAVVRDYQDFSLDMNVKLTDGSLRTGWEYFRESIPFEITNGRLSLMAKTTFKSSSYETMDVYLPNLSVESLALKEIPRQEAFLTLGSLELSRTHLRPFQSDLAIRNLMLRRLMLVTERDRHGELNLARIFASPTSDEAANQNERASDTASKQAGWTFRLDQFDMAGSSVRFRDDLPDGEAVVALNDINVTLRNISEDLARSVSYSVDAILGEGGHIRANGDMIPSPLQQSGSLAFEAIDLRVVNPYLHVQSHAVIESGKLSGEMTQKIDQNRSKGFVEAKGVLMLDELSVHDQRDGAKLIGLGRLEVDPWQFSLEPNNLFIEEVVVDAPYIHASIDQDHTLNLASLMKQSVSDTAQEEVESKVENGSDKPFPLKIARIRLSNGSADFSDASLPIPFVTYIDTLEGDIYNIASSVNETGTLELDGVIDQYGSANIAGKIKAGDPKELTDIQLNFRNLALNTYSPYSAKFVGRKIDAGKLFLDLDYQIESSRMKGANAVVVKKIRLGDRVESEDAVSLPLDLAIALMEDGEGVIDLKMPVEGNVESPEFSYGSVVWKAFTNLIGSVATSPFRFLGSVLGIEGDALKFLEFAPGKSSLEPSVKEKLDHLVNVLGEHPRLNLTVAPVYNTEKDGWAIKVDKALAEAMQRIKSDKKMHRAEVLTKALLEAFYAEMYGRDGLMALAVQVHDAHPDPKVFEAAYVSELEKAFVATRPLDPEALTMLATQRAQSVRSYLVSKGIAPERIQWGSPGETKPDGKWIPVQLGITVHE